MTNLLEEEVTETVKESALNLTETEKKEKKVTNKEKKKDLIVPVDQLDEEILSGEESSSGEEELLKKKKNRSKKPKKAREDGPKIAIVKEEMSCKAFYDVVCKIVKEGECKKNLGEIKKQAVKTMFKHFKNDNTNKLSIGKSFEHLFKVECDKDGKLILSV